MAKRCAGLERKLIVLIYLFAATRELPLFHWLLEANTILSHYYLVLEFAALPLLWRAFRKSSRLIFAACLLLSLYQTRPLLPFYFPSLYEYASPREIVEGQEIRVLQANVAGDYLPCEALTQLSLSEKPNIIGLFGLSSESKVCPKLEALYPFSHQVEGRYGTAGLRILSEYAAASPIQETVGDFLPFIIEGVFTVSATELGKVRIILVHAPPVFSENARETSRVLLRRISTDLRHREENVLVMSALGATPWSSTYGNFIGGARLDNAMYGFGLWRSWQNGSWWKFFTLDHMFFKGEYLRVQSFRAISLDTISQRAYLGTFRLLP